MRLACEHHGKPWQQARTSCCSCRCSLVTSSTCRLCLFAPRQLQVMLPLFCATRAATVVLALAEVAATKLNGQLSAALAGGVGGWMSGWACLLGEGRGAGRGVSSRGDVMAQGRGDGRDLVSRVTAGRCEHKPAG
mgnify:CR=1 FL=1